MNADLVAKLKDPLKFARFLWPDVKFYDKQRDLIYSVEQNDETIAPAANMVGKDFVAAFIMLRFFLTRWPVRVIATSVKSDHLRVLWGELGRYIQRSRVPLLREQGGPLILKHRDIRKIVGGQECNISYLLGMVSEKGEGMAGHHAAHTLLIGDEASGIDDVVKTQGGTWAKRELYIGNPNPCDNFFRKGVAGGDIRSEDGKRFYRKIIRIRAEDSPNVKLALLQKQAGQVPDGRIVLPGVLSWEDYCKRRATWDPMRQKIGLDAEFYEGAEVMLFPRDWLNNAARVAESLRGKSRKAEAIGIDPGEGSSNTSMHAVDRLGIVAVKTRKTDDTADIVDEAIAFMKTHGVSPERCVLDRGGGGKQIADQLRRRGYPVRTVAFGESLMLDAKRSMTRVEERIENREERYAFLNRRAQMYGELRDLLNPSMGGFGIPAEYTELVRQLGPMPLLFDSEGRMRMLPKNRRDPKSKEKTLTELLGCSPDEADSLVLACHGMLHKSTRAKAGAI